MKKIDKILLMIIPILFLSCSSSFIKTTKTRTIKLNGIENPEQIIGVENDLVLIKFDKNDLINLFEKDNSEFYDYRIAKRINDLKIMNSDLIFQNKESKGKLEFAEFEIKFYDLIKKGDVEIYDKSTKQNLKKIKYIFTRDKLGTERLELESLDNKRLYDMILAYGE